MLIADETRILVTVLAAKGRHPDAERLLSAYTRALEKVELRFPSCTHFALQHARDSGELHVSTVLDRQKSYDEKKEIYFRSLMHPAFAPYLG